MLTNPAVKHCNSGMNGSKTDFTEMARITGLENPAVPLNLANPLLPLSLAERADESHRAKVQNEFSEFAETSRMKRGTIRLFSEFSENSFRIFCFEIGNGDSRAVRLAMI